MYVEDTRELKLFDIIQTNKVEVMMPIGNKIYSAGINDKINDPVIIDASEFMQDIVIIEGILRSENIVVPPFTVDDDLNGRAMWIEGAIIEPIDSETVSTVYQLARAYRKSIDTGYLEEHYLNKRKFFIRIGAGVVAVKGKDGFTISIHPVYQLGVCGDEFKETVMGIPLVVELYVNNMGYMNEDRYLNVYSDSKFESKPEGTQDVWTGVTINAVNLVIRALEVINKRLSFDIVEPPPRQRRKLIARELGQSKPVTIHKHAVLHMYEEGVKYVGKTSQSQGTGDGKRAHTVSWHFRRIGPDGLFGKGYKAGELILIPAHRRGHEELGKVDNEYVLHKGRKQ